MLQKWSHWVLMVLYLTKNRQIPVYCSMPKNKQAYIRYRIIDACIRNRQRPYPSKDELIKSCEVIAVVSLRTIEQDLYDMQHDEELAYFAPIRYDKRQKGYYYEDKNYSISNIPLKENDLYALEFAVALLKQFEGIDTVARFGEAVAKIEDYVNVRSLLSETDMAQVIQLEQGTSRLGQEFLSEILGAVKEQKSIQFVYRKFDAQEAKSYSLDPYVLKEYRNRWYVTGKSGSSDTIVTFGLDRIQELKVTTTVFKPVSGFRADDYFKYSFGISVSNKLSPERIVLSFTAQQGAYVLSQPLHTTQELVSQSTDSIEVSINVIPSFELKSQLLSYGSSVRVLEPKWLKEEMQQEVKRMVGNYRD